MIEQPRARLETTPHWTLWSCHHYGLDRAVEAAFSTRVGGALLVIAIIAGLVACGGDPAPDTVANAGIVDTKTKAPTRAAQLVSNSSENPTVDLHASPQPSTVTPIPLTPAATPTGVRIPTATPVPPPTATPVPIPTSTPLPLPDLQISGIDSSFLQVNDDDGSTSYRISVSGSYGLTKPSNNFEIAILGLEQFGIKNQTVANVGEGGLFQLDFPEIRFPPGIYSISFEADIGNAVAEQNEENNLSETFSIEIREPKEFTRAEIADYKKIAHHTLNNKISVRSWGWVEPVRIYVGENIPEQFVKDIEVTVKQHMSFGGGSIEISYVGDVENSNFEIYLVEHAELKSLFPSSKLNFDTVAGNTQLSYSNGRQISRIVIGIATNRTDGTPYMEGFITMAIRHEIAHGLAGLTHSEDLIGMFGVDKNYLNPNYTSGEERIFQLAYEIPAGTSEDDVERYIRVLDAEPTT